MTKQEFIETLKRINPYAIIDETYDYIEIPYRPKYTFTLDDDALVIRYYYCERDYQEDKIPYADIKSEDDIPDELKMSQTERLKYNLIKKIEHIDAPIISDYIQKIKDCEYQQELIEEILLKDDFYLCTTTLDENIIDADTDMFGEEIKPGILYNSTYRLWIIYKGSGDIYIPHYENAIVLGTAAPNITGGQIVRCFYKSRPRCIKTKYVEIHSKDVQVSGFPEFVITPYDNPENIVTDPSVTTIVRS